MTTAFMSENRTNVPSYGSEGQRSMVDGQGCIPSGDFRESSTFSFAASGCQQFLAHSPASFRPLRLLSHLSLPLLPPFFTYKGSYNGSFRLLSPLWDSLFSQTKFPLSHEVTHSQVPGIQMHTTWGYYSAYHNNLLLTTAPCAHIYSWK